MVVKFGKELYHQCGRLMGSNIRIRDESGVTHMIRACNMCHPKSVKMMKKARNGTANFTPEELLETLNREQDLFLKKLESSESLEQVVYSIRPPEVVDFKGEDEMTEEIKKQFDELKRRYLNKDEQDNE